jgi:hypothetical protein
LRRLISLVLLVSLVGCSRPIPESKTLAPGNPTKPQSGQWILESYDLTKGYAFSKDGVTYQAKCSRIEGKASKGHTIEGLGFVWDGPNKYHIDVKDQSQCNELLEYIHKPVGLTNGSILGSDMLLVDRPDGVTIYLQVTSAK